RFGDQLFVHVRAVAVRGVEEIEAQVVRLAQHGVRGGTILRRPPDVGAAHAHRAEAETVDGQVANADGRGHGAAFDATRGRRLDPMAVEMPDAAPRARRARAAGPSAPARSCSRGPRRTPARTGWPA